ncbi:GspH/FimT family pseudopilin [Melaminivora alkalimesophila]|uniref:Type II secretion system protein H n=1 Tax=Melaminivora alkalimesophila TaxID=1165852 RepID=A0A317R896_9BURK|nr:GspH/FimT family pseudopilin [Melaminivora alkalimesophila]PWW43750.1 general secretion pathway protein H [Melaminivora alkalimesophila]
MRERGFTLIELMVVFAIMALIMAVAPLAYDRMHVAAQYRETVRGIATGLRAARQHAVLTGQDALFSVDLERRAYGLQGAPERAIPEAISVRATVAASEAQEGRFTIRFLASGGASGGSVDVEKPSGDGVRLRVDWFSGRIEQEALQP